MRSPTTAQKKIIASYKCKGVYLNPNNWNVVKNMGDKLVLRHKLNLNYKTILKGAVTVGKG
jgi:hypothetical protein